MVRNCTVSKLRRLAEVLVVLVVLLACKRSGGAHDGGTTAASIDAAIPTPTILGSAPPIATIVAAPAPGEVIDGGDIPPMPATKSEPPASSDWERAPTINTAHPRSWPPQCVMKILRDWLRVHCTGKIRGYEKIEYFGRRGPDYTQEILPGRYAVFTLRLKKGYRQGIRICRETGGAELRAEWPDDADRPKSVALTIGLCPGSELFREWKPRVRSPSDPAELGAGATEP